MKRTIFIIMSILTLACGQTVAAVKATPRVTSTAAAPTEPTARPRQTLTPFVAVEQYVVVTADKLTIRKQAATLAEPVCDDCYLQRGAVARVGRGLVTDNPNCMVWFPLLDRAGWICADYVEVMK